ncbi:membrane protein insertase YidC [Foetidibacter luteolus]|uniref:membrane protein insertase YidC n=1 Tax=Foetidibacter luteolus TaxID=2608880 RepID=UPI001F2CB736|nr:membrane protein insertase YidC [Foetidibacter luteolus]
MDKNTVIGMVLLAVLFFVFFWYTNKEHAAQQALNAENERIKDSIAKVEAAKKNPLDTTAARLEAEKNDTLIKKNAAGTFAGAAFGTEQLVTIENELMKATFSSKGGKLKQVELKNYASSANNQHVILGGGKDDVIGYRINTSNTTSAETENLYFTPSTVTKNADGSQTLSFNITAANGQSITHQYIVKPNNYAVDWNIVLNGADQMLSNGLLNFKWQVHPEQHEKNVKYEREQTNICFSEGNDFDYISAKTEKKFEKPVQWVGVVQQFFNSTLIAKDGFNSAGEVRWGRKTDSSNILSDVDVTLQKKLQGSTVTVPLQLYFGPNDYKVLKTQAEDMDKMVNLGRDMYSFVRPINKYIIMPVFNLFASIVSNYGWVILLLTLFIRLVTSPLTYTSYLSGAKMKVLRPEMDALKKKFGDDQQGYAMEQMKLFREAGVNPLGGCIPALLQIPIFFALYSFFNSNIELRGESFLWSKDLSAYDSIVTFPFEVWGLGNHLSLFTITAVLTSFLISIYNMAMTPTQDNPALKYMPYIFPFILFFVFNRLPSALTWYYTVSNLITLGLQFVIQNYIINHDKILAKIEEKRKQPKKDKPKSKWQERFEQTMEAQKKLQEMKQKKK